MRIDLYHSLQHSWYITRILYKQSTYRARCADRYTPINNNSVYIHTKNPLHRMIKGKFPKRKEKKRKEKNACAMTRKKNGTSRRMKTDEIDFDGAEEKKTRTHTHLQWARFGVKTTEIGSAIKLAQRQRHILYLWLRHERMSVFLHLC